MKYLKLFFITLALLCSLKISSAQPCDLHCLASKFQLDFGENIIHFNLNSIPATLTFTNFTVCNFGFYDIQSSIGANSTSVSLKLSRISLDIWALFTLDYNSRVYTGEMDASVISSSKNTWEFQISKVLNPKGLVDSTTLAYCSLYAPIANVRLGFSLPSMSESLKNASLYAFKGFSNETVQNLGCSTLIGLLQAGLILGFDAVNTYVEPYLNGTYSNLPARQVPMFGDYVDLQSSSLIDVAQYIFDEFTGISGPLNLTYLINIVTNGTGILRLSDWYNETIPGFELPIADINAIIGFGLLDVNLSYLNTWDDFEVLVPVTKYKLDSHIGIGKIGVNVSVYLNISINGSSEYVYQEASGSVVISNNDIWAQLQIASFPGLAETYTAAMCTNLSCLLALLNGNSTALTKASCNTTIDLLKLYIFQQGTLETDVANALTTLIPFLLDNYIQIFPPLLDGLLNGVGIDGINPALSAFINNNTCHFIEDVFPEEVDSPATTGAFIAFTLFFIVIALVPFVYFIREKVKKPAPIVKEDGATYSFYFNCFNKNKLKWINEFGRTDPNGASLFLDPRVNVIARFSIPFIVLLDIAFFISSNASIGASVFVLISIGEKQIQLPSLFNFGLINSISDMWLAGVWPLSILIALFSGIWPYIKLLLMFVTWMMPISIYKENWRERSLMLLDMLGKWSLIDSYVMVLMLVAFHIHVTFPIVSTNFVTSPAMLDVYVDAAYGFVSFLLATIISLVLSHIILFIHRNVKSNKEENSGEEASKFKSLYTYCNPKRYVILSRIGILVFLIVALILVIIGVSISSFSFDFFGLAGWALGLLGFKTHSEYSVVSLGVFIDRSSMSPNSFGIRITQLVFVITAFIFPIIHLTTLTFIWVVPLTRKIQKWIYVACEVMNAWSCLEVFVISIIAAILEIRQFTSFMVGDKCDFIDPYIEKFFSAPLNGHSSCFEIQSILQGGCWVLFIACIIYIISAMVVMKECRKALEQRASKNQSDVKMDSNSKSKSNNSHPSSPFSATTKSEASEVLPSTVVINVHPSPPPPPPPPTIQQQVQQHEDHLQHDKQPPTTTYDFGGSGAT